MSDIRTKPTTPEYEESWDRVFGNKVISTIHDDSGEAIAVLVDE